jgi:hypothetical protein
LKPIHCFINLQTLPASPSLLDAACVWPCDPRAGPSRPVWRALEDAPVAQEAFGYFQRWAAASVSWDSFREMFSQPSEPDLP